MNLPNKKYNIIYADPPWTFKTWSNKGKGKSAEQHYDCMTIDAIQTLPIQDICEDNAACIMWVTYPLLKKGIETLEAWGFDYKTVAFTWVKRNKKANSWFTGMGYYTRSNAEIAILGTRGKVLERANKNVPQVCDERIMEHSHKPDVIRQRIVDLFGDISRIELFARQKTKDWDVWGNEVNNYPKDRG
tara:strand:+ start:121 stop:684 length:564 start_codon:yes stop_codon:yes gene_type:complete